MAYQEARLVDQRDYLNYIKGITIYGKMYDSNLQSSALAYPSDFVNTYSAFMVHVMDHLFTRNQTMTRIDELLDHYGSPENFNVFKAEIASEIAEKIISVAVEPSVFRKVLEKFEISPVINIEEPNARIEKLMAKIEI